MANDESTDPINDIPGAEKFWHSIHGQKLKEASAVARLLIAIFGAILLMTILGGLIIMSLHPPGGTDPKSNIITEGVLPLLQGIGTLATTVFGPLLAFVLGFYFGERRAEKSQ